MLPFFNLKKQKKQFQAHFWASRNEGRAMMWHYWKWFLLAHFTLIWYKHVHETKMVPTFKKGIFDHKHRQSSGNRRLSQTDQMGTRVLSATQKHPIEQVIVKSASMSYFRVSPFFFVVFSVLIIIVIVSIFCFWQHMQSSHHPGCPDSC